MSRQGELAPGQRKRRAVTSISAPAIPYSSNGTPCYCRGKPARYLGRDGPAGFGHNLKGMDTIPSRPRRVRRGASSIADMSAEEFAGGVVGHKERRARKTASTSPVLLDATIIYYGPSRCALSRFHGGPYAVLHYCTAGTRAASTGPGASSSLTTRLAAHLMFYPAERFPLSGALARRL